MRWVHNEGEGYCIFEDLGKAAEVLDYGKFQGQDEAEEEEEEEG